MGANDISERERPSHRVRLSSYCMDLTEVTVAAYAECVAAGRCTAPDTGQYCNWSRRGPVAGREQHPINCIDWNQASAYCHFRSGSLPTEAQWEYAARGTDGRIYPWGNTAPASQLCWNGGGASRTSTCSVREHPGTNNANMLFGMSGNVWEWTADNYAAYQPNSGSSVLDPTGPATGTSRVVRGGAWNYTVALYVRAAIRIVVSPMYRYYDVGFRCSRGAM